MKELNLKIEEGTLTDIEYTELGRIFLIKLENKETKIITRYYDHISEYISKEYGSEKENIVGKTIYLISDYNRPLALKNDKDSIVFMRDLISEDYGSIKQYGNTDYIKEEYNLTEEEFIKIIREELNSKKLKLK